MPKTGDEPKGDGGLERATLDTYYLIDKDGNLKPYFKIPFEEFDKLYKLYKGFEAPEQPQRFVLQHLAVSGVVEDRQAQLDLQFRVLTQKDGWVRVPLRLNNCVLREPPSDADSASPKQFVEYEKDGDGYICWIDGKANKSHRVDLRVLAPVRRVGRDNLLSLPVPAATQSQLTIRVPGDDVEAAVGGSQPGMSPDTRPAGDHHTELSTIGLGENFVLSWREKPNAPTALASNLTVSGKVLVRIEAEQRISSIAKLTISNSRPQSPVQSLRVRLPSGTTYVAHDQPSVQSATVREEKVKGEPINVVHIQLVEPLARTVEIELEANMDWDERRLQSPVEVAAFDVLDATTQTGTIDVSLEGDWTATWERGPNVQRLEETPVLSGAGKPIGRFRYLQQPCSLAVQLHRKTKRIAVTPRYSLFVEADKLRLEAKLAYSVRGGEIDSVHVDFSEGTGTHGWEVESLKADVDGLLLDETALPNAMGWLNVPLRRSTKGEFELSLVARRPVLPTETQIRLSFPRPKTDTFSAAVIAVYPANNVEVTPLPDDMHGVTPESSTSAPGPSAGYRSPLMFRGLREAESWTFAGRMLIQPQSISVTGSGNILVDGDQMSIQQNLDYRIAFEPLSELLVDIPHSAYEADDLRIRVDQALLPADSVVTADAAGAGKWVRLRVVLPNPRLNRLQLALNYTLPFSVLEPGQKETISVPAVMPANAAEGQFEFFSWRVELPNSLQIQPDAQTWQIDRREDETASYAVVVKPKAAQSSATLDANLVRRAEMQTTVVTKAWIQSWFSSVGRQDRAVFRLSSSHESVSIRLPRGADLTDVALNGRRITGPAVNADGTVTVELSELDGSSDDVVELWYAFAERDTPRGQVTAELPEVENARWTRRLYWQVVLPPDEYLLFGPDGLTGERSWNWLGLFGTPNADAHQLELENWVGASRQAPLPEETNQYLFSSFGGVPRVSMITARRLEILLAVSAVVLVVGLLLIYVSVLRRPVVLLALGVVLLLAGLFYPEPALQLAQTASLALACVVTAQVLRWTVARPRRGRPIVRGTSIGADAGSTRTHIPIWEGDSASPSTASASLSIVVTDPQSADSS